MEISMETLLDMQAQLTALSTTVEQLLQQARQEGQACPAPAAEEFERVFPLCMEHGFFTGKSVVGVIFPDGVRVETPSWKKLVETVMKRCNDDAAKHRALMALRGRVQGRSRQLLSANTTYMRSPIQIDRGLYMESHYDVESLLRIMETRILDAVGYDYSGIQVAVRNR